MSLQQGIQIGNALMNFGNNMTRGINQGRESQEEQNEKTQYEQSVKTLYNKRDTEKPPEISETVWMKAQKDVSDLVQFRNREKTSLWSQNRNEGIAYLNQAKNALDSGNIDDAETYLDKAYATYPDGADLIRNGEEGHDPKKIRVKGISGNVIEYPRNRETLQKLFEQGIGVYQDPNAHFQAMLKLDQERILYNHEQMANPEVYITEDGQEVERRTLRNDKGGLDVLWGTQETLTKDKPKGARKAPKDYLEARAAGISYKGWSKGKKDKLEKAGMEKEPAITEKKYETAKSEKAAYDKLYEKGYMELDDEGGYAPKGKYTKEEIDDMNATLAADGYKVVAAPQEGTWGRDDYHQISGIAPIGKKSGIAPSQTKKRFTFKDGELFAQ